jgi:hypothetical protein
VNYSNNRFPWFELILVSFIVYGSYNWINDCNNTTITDTGYLKWCDMELATFTKFVYLCLMLFPLLFFPNNYIKFTIFFTTIVSWLYNLNKPAFGSKWCYQSNIISIIVPIILYLQK